MEKSPKKVNKFSFSLNNFEKFIRESEEELGKISYFLGKVDITIKVEKALEKVNKFSFSLNNFQKFIRESE